MKLELRLLKMILKYVECNADGQSYLEPPEFPDYSTKVIEYHLRLCVDAGYIRTATNMATAIRELTWAGQMKLAELRCDS